MTIETIVLVRKDGQHIRCNLNDRARWEAAGYSEPKPEKPPKAPGGKNKKAQ